MLFKEFFKVFFIITNKLGETESTKLVVNMFNMAFSNLVKHAGKDSNLNDTLILSHIDAHRVRKYIFISRFSNI